MDVLGAEICLYTKTAVLVRRGEDIVITPGGNKMPAQVVHAVRNVCFAVCEETSYFTLALGPVVNGQQEINFQADQGRAVHKTWTEPPPDDGDASKTAGDVTRYTLMAMAFVSAFANPFLVACYGLALAGLQVASSVGQWNDLHGKTKAPPLDLGHLRQAMTFRWNGGQGYELTSVALNNGLWFGGVLKNLK